MGKLKAPNEILDKVPGKAPSEKRKKPKFSFKKSRMENWNKFMNESTGDKNVR